VATQAQDDGFHETLNSKQLVFLFMAATVVSVVISCAACSLDAACAANAGESATKHRRGRCRSNHQLPRRRRRIRPTAAAPPAVDDLSYFNRLEAERRRAAEGGAGQAHDC
jgi:hypothetical protein